jgi:hypothetical protein
MMGRDRRSERLARILDDRNAEVEDTGMRAAARAADALTPSVAPRESWRSALKDRMLREAQRAGTVRRTDAGTHDGADVDAVHSVEVATSETARIVLADVEEIDEERAREVAAKLERIARAFAPEGQTRGPQ